MAQTFYPTTLSNIKDLTIPVPINIYPLGKVVVIEESNSIRPNVLAEYMYVQNVALNLTVFSPHIILETVGIDSEIIIAQATGAQATIFPIFHIAVPQVAILQAFYGFVKIKGVTTVLLDGSGVSIEVGDPLHLNPNTFVLVKNTGVAQGTCGIALEAVDTNNTEALVLLNGNKVSTP